MAGSVTQHLSLGQGRELFFDGKGQYEDCPLAMTWTTGEDSPSMRLQNAPANRQP
jgi:hypothetical protein